MTRLTGADQLHDIHPSTKTITMALNQNGILNDVFTYVPNDQAEPQPRSAA